MNLIEHYINGSIVSGSSDRKGKVFNPATGSQESEVRLGSKSDLDQAVEKAKKAFEEWSNKPPLQRARIIFKYKEIIEKNSKKPNTVLAQKLKNELRKKYILVGSDGPFNNVIKTKPPICFTKENVDTVCSEIRKILDK